MFCSPLFWSLPGWLTFLITPGTLVDGVYTALPKNGFTFNNVFNLFRAIPYGIKDTANLVILVLVIGGAWRFTRPPAPLTPALPPW